MISKHLTNDEQRQAHKQPPYFDDSLVINTRLQEIERRQAEREAEEKEYKRRQLRFNSWTVVFTGLLFLTSFVSDWILFRQTSATRESADAAKKAAKVADDTLELMKKSSSDSSSQVERLIAQQQRTADSADKSVQQTQASLASNIQQFQAQERAYFMAETPQFTSDPTPSAPIRASLILKNIGKSTAVKYSTYAKFLPFRPTKSVTDLVTFLDEQFDALHERTKLKGKYGQVSRADLAPNESIFITEETPPMTEADIAKFKDVAGGLVLFYVGTVQYQDVFKIPHETEFCRFYFGQDTKIWHICDSHNVMR